MRELGHVDHRNLAQPAVQLVQPGVDEPLPFLGGVIFRVFLQIAVGPGLEDLAGKFDAELDFERRDFFLELFDQFFHRLHLRL